MLSPQLGAHFLNLRGIAKVSSLDIEIICYYYHHRHHRHRYNTVNHDRDNAIAKMSTAMGRENRFESKSAPR